MQKVKSVSIESKVQKGDTSLQLVTSIPLFLPKIKEFTFVRYRVSPGLDIRLASVQEANDRDLVKDQAGFSGWYSSQRIQSSDTKKLLHQLLAHNGRAEQNGRFVLQRDEILSGCLEERATSLGPDEVLGICSLCKTSNGRSWHLPMLDFNIAPSRDARELVFDGMRQLLDCDGYLLESGKSYHYYGLTLLSWNRFADFLSRSLLLTPLTDIRYIAHRLISRMGVLRITANKEKPNEPRVVCKLE